MILITGGAGFIGINFVRMIKGLIPHHKILVADNLSYASNSAEIRRHKEIKFEVVDIANPNSVKDLFNRYHIDSVINFAAETHVDNSIKDCMPFVYSNVIGTVNLLQASLAHGVRRFLHISTDEVFGEIAEGSFNEQSPVQPRNPYSASKASAEHFVEAFRITHGLHTVIVNCSNNYGPWQHREKFIPLTISNLMQEKPVPVYGDGEQVRDWIYVEDACRAIYEVFQKGQVGERYCIGGDTEIKNIDIVNKIIDRLGADKGLVQFVKDRPGHDRRYYTDCAKIKKDLGWTPQVSLDQGLDKTIEWYKNENRI
jgi:dTDP-glucose 4,6-dehydratase